MRCGFATQVYIPYMPILTTCLLLFSIVLWRFLPAFAFAGFGIVCCTTLALGLLKPPKSKGLITGLIGLIALLTTLATTTETLWPGCTACSIGKHYTTLWGIATSSLGAIAYLGLSILGFMSMRSEEKLGSLRDGYAVVLIGCTTYYLYLSIYLGMVCEHCLPIHGCILFLFYITLSSKLRPLTQILLLICAGLSLHFAYHPHVRSFFDTPPIQAPHESHIRENEAVEKPLSAEDTTFLIGVDRGLHLGNRTAPHHIEIGFSFTCSRCSQMVPRMIEAIREPIHNGKLSVRFLPLPTPGNPNDFVRTSWSYAAAQQGRFVSFTRCILGSGKMLEEDDLYRYMIEHDFPQEALDSIRSKAKIHKLAAKSLANADIHTIRSEIKQVPFIRVHDYSAGTVITFDKPETIFQLLSSF